jgi:hypothetical protein
MTITLAGITGDGTMDGTTGAGMAAGEWAGITGDGTMDGTTGAGMAAGVWVLTTGVGMQDSDGAHHILVMEDIMATIIIMSLIIQHVEEIIMLIRAETVPNMMVEEIQLNIMAEGIQQ